MSYEDEMYIDENALDVELLEQPQLVVRYSTQLAEAKAEQALAKEAIDYEKAQIDFAVREDPDKFGIGKITENAINNAILIEDSYRKLLTKYNEATRHVNILQGVVYAINDRKSSLENLVKLHGQQYFAGPSVPHNLAELREEKRDEMHHRIGKSMKRTIKKK
jgi:hypothetical protein